MFFISSKKWILIRSNMAWSSALSSIYLNCCKNEKNVILCWKPPSWRFIMKRSVDIYVVLEKSFRSLFYKVFNFKTQVIDLLNPGTSRKPLMVRWSKKTRGFFVENLFTVECEELDDLLAVLEEGSYIFNFIFSS